MIEKLILRHLSGTYYTLSIAIVLLLLFPVSACAQENGGEEPVPLARVHREGNLRVANDTLVMEMQEPDADELDEKIDSILQEEGGKMGELNRDSSMIHYSLSTDSLLKNAMPATKERFMPNPKKALWLAMVIPGGGQIYNRKYWKLPLIYGGFMGCLYAMNWNNTMYRDYSQAYIDIMDSDENTKSYENFLPEKYDVSANMTRLQEMFKRKKNYYRRYRDLSMFCMIGVYALSIIDAYVDAEMSSFDITRDLSMKVHPAVIHERFSTLQAQGGNSTSYGLRCCLTF